MCEYNWRGTSDEPGWMPPSYCIAVKDEDGNIIRGELDLDDVGNSGDDEWPIWSFLDEEGKKYMLGDFEEFAYMDDEESDRDENQ